jgi:RHS repeat-associated protein
MPITSHGSFFRLLVLSAALAVFLPGSLAAQTTAARPDRGILPGASYAVSELESVSLTNGNALLTIPLASLPSIAGGKLKFTVNAVYNSKLWNVTRREDGLGPFQGCPRWVVDTPQLSDLGGWRIPVGYRLIFRDAHEDFDYLVPAKPPTEDECLKDAQEQLRLQSRYYRLILITPDGAEHELRPLDSSSQYSGTRSTYLLNYYKDTPATTGAAMRYYSFDGSYLYAVVNPSSASTLWTVYMNDGTRIVQSSDGVQRITDTNGNSIKIFSDANGTHIQDELTGREIRVTDNKVSYQTVTGATQSIDIVRGDTLVRGKIYQVDDWSPTGGESGGGFVCKRNDLLTTLVPVIREIVFPVTEPGVSARRYSFSYNSDTTSTATDDWRLSCGMALTPNTRTVSNGMGELSQVVTPSGAIVKYSYSKSSIHNFSFDVNDIPRATVTQKQIIHDGITDTWTYDITEFGGCGGTVTAPDGSVSIEQCYPHDPAWSRFFGYTDDKGGLVYRSWRSGKEMVERHWTLVPFSGANTNLTGSSGLVTFNPVVDIEYRTLLDDTAEHKPIKMAATKFQYDFNGNLIQQVDYDWFDPSLITSRDGTGLPAGVPGGATILRTTNYAHYNQAATASSANVYAKRSLSTATPLILNAPQQTTLGPSIVQFSYDGKDYGVAPTVGNLTAKTVRDDVDDKWIKTSSTYDIYGNVATATDGRGNVTQYFFEDDTHAMPTRVVVDPENDTGTQTTTIAYDFATGLVISQTDVNGQESTIDYTNQLLSAPDPFGRAGVSIGPLVNVSGIDQRHRTTMTYEDHLQRVTMAADLNAENDGLLKSRTTNDMLGRPILIEQTEDGSSYTIYTRKAYDQMGRISYASNPMRVNVSADTDGWTRITNDDLGRVTEVATFGGATQPAASGTSPAWTGSVTTAYAGNFTTVTDQAGKVRRSLIDALGRLIRLDEPDVNNNLGSTSAPVQPTSYAYDVFGNLLKVTQGSQPPRSFTYDALSRLRTATHPESGTVNYEYDEDGNLTKKIDSRFVPNSSTTRIATSYAYDALNRVTSRSYNDGMTPTASYVYDAENVANSKGRLTSVSSSVSSYSYGEYDELGRVKKGTQTTDGQAYVMSYDYDLAGNLISQKYPSDRVVKTNYDSAGRIAGVKNDTGGYYVGFLSTDASNRIEYTAAGAPQAVKLGNGLWEHTNFNSRLQPTQIRLGSASASSSILQLDYGYGATNNNGNLQSQTITVPKIGTVTGFTATQTYTYDSLNRLATASENNNSWTQNFDYDRYGNRKFIAGTTLPSSLTSANNPLIDPNNNRIDNTKSGQMNIAYDNAGNLTRDISNRPYEYDAENKMVNFDGGATTGGGASYSYDGNGQRVKKVVGGAQITTTVFVYNISGQLVAEYASSGSTGGGTSYITSDTLGSPRVITDAAQKVKGRHDYLPFGEELLSGTGGRTGQNQQNFSADNLRKKFTSKERDNETGLDYFVARYYSAVQGRFTTADSFGGDRHDPKTLNRYSYVLNNPLSLTDPTGHIPQNNQLGKYQDPAKVPPARKEGDPFPVADALGGGSPFGKIAEINADPPADTPITTTEANPEAVFLNLKDLSKPVLMSEYNPQAGEPLFGSYTQLNFSIPIAGFFGADFSLTKDDWGNVFLGAGPGIGFGNYFNVQRGIAYTDADKEAKTEDEVGRILRGPSTTGTLSVGFPTVSASYNNLTNDFGSTIPLVPAQQGGTVGLGFGAAGISISQTSAIRIIKGKH